MALCTHCSISTINLHFCSRSPMTCHHKLSTVFSTRTFRSVALTKAASRLARKVTAPATSAISPSLQDFTIMISPSVQLMLDLQLIWNLPQVGSQWPRPPFAAACKLLFEDTIMMWDLRFTFATSGDQIQPGETEFTLIRYFARSNAMFFVRMLTAPLDAA